MMKKYYSVERGVENEIVIERSRFITNVCSAPTEEIARAFLEEIRKKYSLATHNCFACVCEKGAIKRSSDDGEPGGTAGQPILDAILSQNLVDTAVVVTRFFGGIKLGAGGLVRAYSKSASDALKLAGRAEFQFCVFFKIVVPYDKISKVAFLNNDKNVKIISNDYGEKIKIVFATLEDNQKSILEKLNEALSGNVEIELLKTDFMQIIAL